MATLLMVEDNEVNAAMLQARLEHRGFTVLVATNGTDAVAMSLQARPDLILMDINLPDIDGFEATRRIKQDARTASIPVIALTAHAMVGNRDQSVDAGCDDYEAKPIDMARLVAKIEAFIAADVEF